MKKNKFGLAVIMVLLTVIFIYFFWKALIGFALILAILYLGWKYITKYGNDRDKDDSY